MGQIFEFGEQKPFTNRKGEVATQADLSLKFLADWRVSLGAETVFGSGDHGSGKRRFYDRKTPPREEFDRVRWKRAKEFLRRVEERTLVVESVNVTDTGIVFVKLSDGYEIAGFRCGTELDDLLYYSRKEDRSILVCESGMLMPDGP